MIYFIQDSNSHAIKIGVSKNPIERLAALQTANHTPLALIAVMDGTEQDETALHRVFTRKRGEWFVPTQDLLVFIRENAVCMAALAQVRRSRIGQARGRAPKVEDEDFQAKAEGLASLYNSGQVTNLAKGIESTFGCSRSSKEDSPYQRARHAVELLTTKQVEPTPIASRPTSAKFADDPR